ncbi:MAG: sterol-binding protein [Alphaproteobacteria bacterium]|nr:MAG: sterol-binding protein [Alphaproteobacteria bacterium]
MRTSIGTRPPAPGGALSRAACFIVQPVLGRIVHQVAKHHSSVFARLGEHRKTDYVIDPVELPFALHLRPDPERLIFRAVPRDRLPPAGATIRGRFMLLLELIDAEQDGDAAFFSRDLEIGGDTEAVVRLRNALDDMDGSIAQEVADMFGPPGRAILSHLRQHYESAELEGQRR